jgi:hypothetical protein
VPRVPITDLGGSLNQGRPPSELAPNEYTALSNFYQFGSKLRRRGGMRRLTTAAFTERITGLVSYRPDVPPPGGVDMIVAGLTRFGALAGVNFRTLANQGGFAIASSTRRWTLFQYKNILYGIRDQASLVRSDGITVGPSGIAAPSSAPTLADGGAGSIPAASFKGVYTFYNSATDLESNPSPVSNTLALGANRMINWSGIAVSTNPQVTSRRIYRTLPDQSGEYFLVTEIPNNTETTHNGDNTLAQDLDVAVSMVNGLPPPSLLLGTVWKERLFASDGKDLFHSEDGLIEAFDPQAIIPVFPDDGHEIRAIHAYGDRLVVGKTNKVHYLVGSDPETFALLTLTDRHGCISHHTMQSAEGYLFWLGLDNVYRSDGNAVVGIASVKLRTLIEGMDDVAASDAVATIFPTLGWYVLSIPGYAQLIYNYRTDVWAPVPTLENIQAVGDFFDLNRAQDIYVADASGWVYRFHDTTYGYDDTATAMGGAIAASFDSRAFGAEAATKHVVERAALLCARYSEQITLAIISEGVSLKSRTVSLGYEPRWKPYNLSTRHAAKSQSQLRVTYTGATAIELEGFALDIEPLDRPTMLAA